MQDLGYGAGYQYAHDAAEAYIPQEYLPEPLVGTTFYTPGAHGFEKDVARRMAWWAELRTRSADRASSTPRDADRPSEGTPSDADPPSDLLIAVPAPVRRACPRAARAAVGAGSLGACASFGRRVFETPVVSVPERRGEGPGAQRREPGRAPERVQPDGYKLERRGCRTAC
jgi:hypothetical protein